MRQKGRDTFVEVCLSEASDREECGDRRGSGAVHLAVMPAIVDRKSVLWLMAEARRGGRRVGGLTRRPRGSVIPQSIESKYQSIESF